MGKGGNVSGWNEGVDVGVGKVGGVGVGKVFVWDGGKVDGLVVWVGEFE